MNGEVIMGEQSETIYRIQHGGSKDENIISIMEDGIYLFDKKTNFHFEVNYSEMLEFEINEHEGYYNHNEKWAKFVDKMIDRLETRPDQYYRYHLYIRTEGVVPKERKINEYYLEKHKIKDDAFTYDFEATELDKKKFEEITAYVHKRMEECRMKGSQTAASSLESAQPVQQANPQPVSQSVPQVNPQPMQQAAVPQISVADEIKKFKDLLDMGAITQEEYDAQKKRLLS